MERLRAALLEHKGNRTQRDLARELGLHESTLSRIFHGNRTVGLDVLRRIAHCPELRDAINTLLEAEVLAPYALDYACVAQGGRHKGSIPKENSSIDSITPQESL